MFCSADFFLGLAACLCRCEFCPTPLLLGFVMFLCRQLRGVEVAVENPCRIVESERFKDVLWVPGPPSVQDLPKELDGIEVSCGDELLVGAVVSGYRRKTDSTALWLSALLFQG